MAEVVEELSRDQLIALVHRQGRQIIDRDGQIATMAAQVSQLVEDNERLVTRLAKLEHLLARNSGNSSSPPSKDDEPGKTPPTRKKHRDGPKRARGKQPGAPGANLAWTDDPDDRLDRYPQGRCECGHDLGDAVDLGVTDSYQQHEIPQVSARITQYDQHSARCDCGRVHIAERPAGARCGPVGYGPNLQAFVVYLMVMHYIPVARCVQLCESLTGAAPSVGFVHGMINRASSMLVEVDKRIRTLITLAYAVSCDETPLRVGPKTPKPGRKKAEKYLLVACTEAYTHYLLGDRDMDTFKASVFAELTGPGHVIVHDRYANYDSAQLGEFVHQLCTQHLLRDLDDAGEVYPGEQWPAQIADALRVLIHHANLARADGAEAVDADILADLVGRFRDGVLVGLSATASGGTRPGQRKARLLLETLRDRPDDVLRFAGDLRIPPTSNQAERDLRPSKIQQNISGRLTSEARTTDRYRIRGYTSTAVKHQRKRWLSSWRSSLINVAVLVVAACMSRLEACGICWPDGLAAGQSGPSRGWPGAPPRVPASLRR